MPWKLGRRSFLSSLTAAGAGLLSDDAKRDLRSLFSDSR
jgi:hypothetical protein